MKKMLVFLFITNFLTMNGQSTDTLMLKIGDTLNLKFEDQIGMGYTWQLEENSVSEFLVLISNKSIPNNKDLDGGTLVREFVFRAADKGIIKLSFILRRGASAKSIPKERKIHVIQIY